MGISNLLIIAFFTLIIPLIIFGIIYLLFFQKKKKNIKKDNSNILEKNINRIPEKEYLTKIESQTIAESNERLIERKKSETAENMKKLDVRIKENHHIDDKNSGMPNKQNAADRNNVDLSFPNNSSQNKSDPLSIFHGILMLLLGTAIIFTIPALGIRDKLARNSYLSDPAWKSEVRHVNKSKDFSIINRIEEMHRAKATKPAIFVGLLFACIALISGNLLSKSFDAPPFLYVFLTGIIPGYLIFFGCQKIHFSRESRFSSKNGIRCHE